MMFEDLLARLETAQKNGQSFREVCTPKDIKNILGTPEIIAGSRELLGSSDKEGLPTYFGKGKSIVTIHQGKTWEISLVRQSLFGDEPFLVSSPNPILGLCVAGEGTSKITFYRINGNTEAISLAPDWTLEKEREITIKKGDVFECTNPDQVMGFTELAHEHVFLRIVHKPIRPLMFAFDKKTMRFSYVTYSDYETTAKFFFGDLLVQMINDPACLGDFSEEQLAELIRFCNAEIKNEDNYIKVRWRMLQVLGMVSEGDAVQWLETFSRHPDPGVSQLAAQTLSQVQGGAP